MPAPSLATPGAQIVAPGTTIPIPVALTDPDVATNGGQMQLDVWCQSGKLNTGTIKGATSLKLAGALPQIQAYLASLTYGAASVAGSDTIGLSVWDQLGRNVQASVGVTVTPGTVAAPAPANPAPAAIPTPAILPASALARATCIRIEDYSADANIYGDTDAGPAATKAAADGVTEGLPLSLLAKPLNVATPIALGTGSALTSLTPRIGAATLIQRTARPILLYAGTSNAQGTPATMAQDTALSFLAFQANGQTVDKLAPGGVSRMIQGDGLYRFHWHGLRFKGGLTSAARFQFCWDGLVDFCDFTEGGWRNRWATIGQGSIDPALNALALAKGRNLGQPLIEVASNGPNNAPLNSSNCITFRDNRFETAEANAILLLIWGKYGDRITLANNKFESGEADDAIVEIYDQTGLVFDGGRAMAGGGGQVQGWTQGVMPGQALGAAFKTAPNSLGSIVHLDGCAGVTGCPTVAPTPNGNKWASLVTMKGCDGADGFVPVPAYGGYTATMLSGAAVVRA